MPALAAAVSAKDEWGILRNWRVTYYACGVLLACLGQLTRYRTDVSLTFVALCLLLLCGWYGGEFVIWLIRSRGSKLPSPVEHGPTWAVAVADRSALFLSIPLFWACFAPVKASIPAFAGFWADPYLSQGDRLLLGRDAWEFTHALIGDQGTRIIDVLYALWIPVMLILAFLVAVTGSEELRARFYVGWGLIWLVLGVGVAFALASAGPTFGGHLGFGYSDLIARLDAVHASTPLFAVSAREALWASFQSGSASTGNGISASPSLHCALSFFLVALSRRTVWSKPALAYSLVVWIGSVHLGWHYFVDGLISLVGVILLWPLIKKIASGSEGNAYSGRPGRSAGLPDPATPVEL